MPVAFVQSEQNRQILQGARISIPDLIQTGIEEGMEIPQNFALDQNYPNPFNSETKINFYTTGGSVSLKVYDLTGALVRTLISGSVDVGHHSVNWDGIDDRGKMVASGVYFYRLSGFHGDDTKRMILLK